ncbi:SusD/RagB family nutrient-binding outer membrane lipoprotein [Chryseobacterium sp. HMWF028]|nr:SusD/RagB family nutrient-binding outer membrane lipoprotein [Chryseobacterium sp. HMWF028]
MISCERNITELNNDPKHPAVLPSGNLLATGQYQSFYYMYTGNVNNNNYRFFEQYWAETTYTDETNYDLVTRNQPRNHFNRMYVYSLNNFHQAMTNLQAEGITDAAVYNNKWATLEISSIFVWENIVDTFGDVPYSEALQVGGGQFAPKYDDAKGIYTSLLSRIDAAIAKINTSSPGYSEDLVYGGNMSKWKKLANSIKLRLAMNLADVDPATSKAAAESAISSGVLGSNSDAYSMTFSGGTFTNPIYDDLVASGRNDFVPSKVLLDFMNTNNDPRRAAWFTTVGGIYKGGIFGSLNPYGNYSHLSSTLLSSTAPANLLSYSEVLFLETEAAARGYSVGGSADVLYASAILASMNENGIAVADAATYITANPYNAVNWKLSIGSQAWIALFNSPFAAWNFTRRLDSPVFVNPPNSKTDGVPVRMPYSDQEYVLNKTNVTAAASKIGGDKATTKLFWDKF